MEQHAHRFQVLGDTVDECGLGGCTGKLQKIMDMPVATADTHRVQIEMRCQECGQRQPERTDS